MRGENQSCIESRTGSLEPKPVQRVRDRSESEVQGKEEGEEEEEGK